MVSRACCPAARSMASVSASSACSEPSMGTRLAQIAMMLRVWYAVLPIAAGTDKFFHLLTNWDNYLSPRVQSWLPVSGHTFMLAVGVIEICAGILVAIAPRIGGWIVA